MQIGAFEILNHTGANALHLLESLLVRAGIPKRDPLGRSVGLHSLRHTAATFLARAGVPLIQAQHLLGHSDPKLTAALYVHLGADDLRSAVSKLPNLGGEDRKGQAEPMPLARTGTDSGSILAMGPTEGAEVEAPGTGEKSRKTRGLRQNSPSRIRTYNQAVNSRLLYR